MSGVSEESDELDVLARGLRADALREMEAERVAGTAESGSRGEPVAAAHDVRATPIPRDPGTSDLGSGLRACPFCGGEATMGLRLARRAWWQVRVPDDVWEVRCTADACVTLAAGSVDDATRRWNTRRMKPKRGAW